MFLPIVGRVVERKCVKMDPYDELGCTTNLQNHTICYCQWDLCNGNVPPTTLTMTELPTLTEPTTSPTTKPYNPMTPATRAGASRTDITISLMVSSASSVANWNVQFYTKKWFLFSNNVIMLLVMLK